MRKEIEKNKNFGNEDSDEDSPQKSDRKFSIPESLKQKNNQNKEDAISVKEKSKEKEMNSLYTERCNQSTTIIYLCLNVLRKIKNG